jgi:nicotinamidase-related amidase
MSSTDLAIDRARAALLVVDVQERLLAAMSPDDAARVVKNCGILIEAARQLGVPIVASEQYRKGLGPTVAPLDAALTAAGARRFEKLEFSAEPGIVEERDQWIVCGMETHVCVYQTVRGLAARGRTVHVPADAVCSRTAENKAVGLALAEKAGAIVTSTETVVFDALGRAGTDEFKALSKLIK